MRRLLDAAMIAFDQRGYYDTRINDVVKIAKTSHGTFYLYFSNKEDLLRALVTEAGAQFVEMALVVVVPESGDEFLDLRQRDLVAHGSESTRLCRRLHRCCPISGTFVSR